MFSSRSETNPLGYLTINDLKVSEVDEADRYGLTKETYSNIGNMFINRYKDLLRKEVIAEEQDIKKKLDAEIRPSIIREIKELITGNTRKEAEEAFVKEKRVEIRKEIEREIASAVPTPKQREQARDMVREFEVAALTSFRAASDILDKEEAKYADEHSFRQVVWYGLWLASVPAIAYCYIVKHWGFDAMSLWATIVSFVVALVVSGITNDNFEIAHKEKVRDYRACAKYCKQRANEAKKMRAVEIDAANTKGDLVNIVKGMTADNSDIVLTANVLEKARIRVRDEIATDMDPEQFLRVMDKNDLVEQIDQVGQDQKKLSA